MKYVYVAAPYTKGDPILNTRAAILTGNLLIRHGFVPFVPHLSLIWHLVSPKDVGEWYGYDNQWLARCDAVLRLPGDSRGADDEVELAGRLGIPVFSSIEDLLRARAGFGAEVAP